MGMGRNRATPTESAHTSFVELYAAHERLEVATTRCVRLLLEADRNGLKRLARFAERCARRCMRDSLSLEDEIKQLL
jgi:hypothetical protein